MLCRGHDELHYDDRQASAQGSQRASRRSRKRLVSALTCSSSCRPRSSERAFESWERPPSEEPPAREERAEGGPAAPPGTSGRAALVAGAEAATEEAPGEQTLLPTEEPSLRSLSSSCSREAMVSNCRIRLHRCEASREGAARCGHSGSPAACGSPARARAPEGPRGGRPGKLAGAWPEDAAAEPPSLAASSPRTRS
mmetsp:Transcript_64620/g.185895  ORF Transcript_64620/g.185895 Transcript_64620/m.185895 type:complete len:197 (-) Transcript_64620:585-1175(-)